MCTNREGEWSQKGFPCSLVPKTLSCKWCMSDMDCRALAPSPSELWHYIQTDMVLWQAISSMTVSCACCRGQLKRPQMQKGMLITPRESWPALTGGLSMEYFGEEFEEGQRHLCFEYVQSSGYQVRMLL